ncbi:hypothetical protein BLNAU_24694 [Blattamonas nauphoetae]|uniref:Uncharacterized protein n=1 Tax=Blattamonas nauphoetae TaxID=2049346 RepID=A0ABQ9WLR3_9EUKA|nr:hypothetical protein BLNAU_24694 [Blattamonas nauphoetae]
MVAFLASSVDKSTFPSVFTLPILPFIDTSSASFPSTEQLDNLNKPTLSSTQTTFINTLSTPATSQSFPSGHTPISYRSHPLRTVHPTLIASSPITVRTTTYPTHSHLRFVKLADCRRDSPLPRTSWKLAQPDSTSHKHSSFAKPPILEWFTKEEARDARYPIQPSTLHYSQHSFSVHSHHFLIQHTLLATSVAVPERLHYTQTHHPQHDAELDNLVTGVALLLPIDCPRKKERMDRAQPNQTRFTDMKSTPANERFQISLWPTLETRGASSFVVEVIGKLGKRKKDEDKKKEEEYNLLNTNIKLIHPLLM